MVAAYCAGTGEAGLVVAGDGETGITGGADDAPLPAGDDGDPPFGDEAPGPFHSPGTPGIVLPRGALAGNAASGCVSTADATGTGNGPPSLAASGVGTGGAGTGAAGRVTGAFGLVSGDVFVKRPVTQSEARVHQSLYQ